MKYTMAEFIKAHKLGVDPKNSAATKVIAEKLRASGFRQVKMRHGGTIQRVWTNEKDVLADLKSKLASLKL